jgi:hypothetical protein
MFTPRSLVTNSQRNDCATRYIYGSNTRRQMTQHSVVRARASDKRWRNTMLAGFGFGWLASSSGWATASSGWPRLRLGLRLRLAGLCDRLKLPSVYHWLTLVSPSPVPSDVYSSIVSDQFWKKRLRDTVYIGQQHTAADDATQCC